MGKRIKGARMELRHVFIIFIFLVGIVVADQYMYTDINLNQNTIYNVSNVTTNNLTVTDTAYGIRLDMIENPINSKEIVIGGNTITWSFTNPNAGMIWNMTGGWTGNALEIHDEPGGGVHTFPDSLLYINGENNGVIPLRIHHSQNDGTSLLVDNGIIDFTGADEVNASDMTTEYLLVKNSPAECTDGYYMTRWNGTESVCVLDDDSAYNDTESILWKNSTGEIKPKSNQNLNMSGNNIYTSQNISAYQYQWSVPIELSGYTIRYSDVQFSSSEFDAFVLVEDDVVDDPVNANNIYYLEFTSGVVEGNRYLITSRGTLTDDRDATPHDYLGLSGYNDDATDGDSFKLIGVSPGAIKQTFQTEINMTDVVMDSLNVPQITGITDLSISQFLKVGDVSNPPYNPVVLYDVKSAYDSGGLDLDWEAAGGSSYLVQSGISVQMDTLENNVKGTSTIYADYTSEGSMDSVFQSNFDAGAKATKVGYYSGYSPSLFENMTNIGFYADQDYDYELQFFPNFYIDSTSSGTYINSTSGNVIFQNDTGPGTIEYGAAIEHTYVWDKDMTALDKLPDFDNQIDATGKKDHKAIGSICSVDVKKINRSSPYFEYEERCKHKPKEVCSGTELNRSCEVVYKKVCEEVKIKKYNTYICKDCGVDTGCIKMMALKANAELLDRIEELEKEIELLKKRIKQ